MPPTEEMLNEANDRLSELSLETFTTMPDTVRPFGSTTLTWRVTGPTVAQGPAVLLAGRNWELPVPRAGSRQVTPGDQTTSFQLRALMHTVYRFLGSRVVTVDGTDCTTAAISESDVREQVRHDINDRFGGDGETRNVHGIDITVTTNGPTYVDVDSSGLRIRTSLNIGIPNLFDPTIKVNALAILSAESGLPVVSFRRFSTDTQLPWWVWLSGAAVGLAGIGLTAVLDEVVNRLVKPEVRNGVGAGLQSALGEAVNLLNITGQTLISLTTAQDRVLFTTCPQG